MIIHEEFCPFHPLNFQGLRLFYKAPDAFSYIMEKSAHKEGLINSVDML